MEGWVKLHRELISKPIWKLSTPEQKTILITLLCMVNHDSEEWEWKGEKFVCNPGQKVTSLDKIAEESGNGVTTQNVRTALKRFEKYNFLTNESTKTGRLITVVNWGIYQCDESESNKQANKDLTKSQQRPNKDLTPNKNDKNDKNDKNKKNIYGEYGNVRMSAEDMEKLTKEFPADWQERIERLSEYMASTGKSYKNHLATIRAWSRKEKHDDTGTNTGAESPQGKPGGRTDKYAAFYKA